MSIKGGIAVCMMSVMYFMFPATPIYQSVEKESAYVAYMIVLIGAAGLVTSIFIGAVITNSRRRKRRLDIKEDQLNV